MRLAAACFAAVMRLIFGVDVPLDEDEAVVGVPVPDSAGVPAVGRRLEIRPVVVRCKANPPELDDSESSYMHSQWGTSHRM